MRRSIYLPALLAAGVGTLSIPSLAHADTEDFHLIWQSVDVNRQDDTATFTLNFSHEPVFFAADGAAEQLHAFQLEIDADINSADAPLGFDDVDTVIRGAEIYRGDGIPVRDRDGAGGEGSGGWGPVRALLPFELDNNTLTFTFTTGLKAIGDDDGRFRYRLITTDAGTLTSTTQAAIIPLPAALWPGVAMLGALGAVLAWRKPRA
jgi:hypothetical protein